MEFPGGSGQGDPFSPVACSGLTTRDFLRTVWCADGAATEWLLQFSERPDTGGAESGSPICDTTGGGGAGSDSTCQNACNIRGREKCHQAWRTGGDKRPDL